MYNLYTVQVGYPNLILTYYIILYAKVVIIRTASLSLLVRLVYIGNSMGAQVPLLKNKFLKILGEKL